MAKETLDFTQWQMDRLKDPSEAAAYLNEFIKDDGEGDYEERLLIALRTIATAHGMANVAEKSQLGRESLYKSLSGGGDPKLRTFTAVLGALGLCLKIGVKDAVLMCR
jgi:probable addiction module antidote protein